LTTVRWRCWVLALEEPLAFDQVELGGSPRHLDQVAKHQQKGSHFLLLVFLLVLFKIALKNINENNNLDPQFDSGPGTT
jgi:hypothetical protein